MRYHGNLKNRPKQLKLDLFIMVNQMFVSLFSQSLVCAMQCTKMHKCSLLRKAALASHCQLQSSKVHFEIFLNLYCA